MKRMKLLKLAMEQSVDVDTNVIITATSHHSTLFTVCIQGFREERVRGT